MATCLEIIEGALVELGARPLGDAVGAEEAARGLALMQAMYREAVEKGVFGRVEEYLASDDYEAEEGQRVYSAGHTITLPTTIEDADTGDDRRPLDLAMIQVVYASADPQISIYDAHVGAWVRIDNLTLAGTAPFSGRNRHGLECALAGKLAASFQRPVPDSTNAYASGLASVLTNRFSAPRSTPAATFY